MKLIKTTLSKIGNNATLMSWSSFFVQFGSALFVLPLIMIKYNETDQAFWFLVGTIRGFATLAEIGFGFIIIRAVSFFYSGLKKLPKNIEEYNKNDKQEAGEPNYKGLSELLSTVNIIYIFLGTIVLLLVSTLGIATVKNLFNIAGNPPHLWFAFISIALSTVMYIQTIQWQHYMGGLNYVAKGYRFGTLLGIIRITVFCVILMVNLGVEFLCFYIFLDSLFAYAYYRRFVQRWFKKKNIKRVRLKFNKEIFNSLWPITWKTGLSQWGEYFLNNGPMILAAQIKDVPLMASFLFTFRVFSMVRRTSEAPFYTHIPQIYRLMAVKDFVTLKSKASIYIFTSLVLQLVSFTILGIWGNEILDFVGINSGFLPRNMFFIVSITFFVLTHSGFHANIYVSTNHIPYMIPMLISGALMMGVGYLTLDKYGLMGIIFIYLAIWCLFLGWYQVYISLKLLSWNVFSYIFDLFKNGISFFYDKALSLKKLKQS